MKKSKFLVVALILGLFQLTFIGHFRVFGVAPDLFLVTVAIAGIFFEARWAFFFAIAAGIFKDIFSLNMFGRDILLFGIWSLLIIKISRKISIEDNFAAALLLFIIALLQNIISGSILVYSGHLVPFGIFLRIVFLGSLYTALTLPLVLKIVKI